MREIGERRALLRIDGTPHAAVAGAQTFADVAAGRIDGPAHLLAAVVQGAVVGVDVVEVDLLDAESLLHFLEVQPQGFRGDRRAVLLTPGIDHVVRCAEARRPVDHRSAAHGAALQDGDRQIRRRAVSPVLVQVRVRRRFLHVEVGLGVVAAFFEDDHLGAGVRQARRDDRAAGAAPHDAQVGSEHHVLPDLVATDDAAHRRLRGALTVRTSSYGGPG